MEQHQSNKRALADITDLHHKRARVESMEIGRGIVFGMLTEANYAAALTRAESGLRSMVLGAVNSRDYRHVKGYLKRAGASLGIRVSGHRSSTHGGHAVIFKWA